MDSLESQVVITSIRKAVTVAGSLCSTSERAFLEVDMRGQFDKTLHRQRNDCRHSTGPCRTNQGYLVTSLQVELWHKASLKMTKVCQRACPSSIVSVSSLLYSVATCS